MIILIEGGIVGNWLFVFIATMGASACASDRGGLSSANQFERIERVTRLEALIPDQGLRSLYDAEPVQRSPELILFTFALRPQAGMKAKRHHQILVVKWSRPTLGRDQDKRFEKPTFEGGGPNGAYMGQSFMTRDGLWRLEISQSSLLPEGVKSAQFNLSELGSVLLTRYDSESAR